MTLRVIGSGFGRTGTMSTKQALEQLGFGPCHHMVEVMGNLAQPAHWKAIAAGETPDWRMVFAGYGAQVDWPGAAVWRETAAAFSDAKLVLTERPEDEWWNSFSVTIGKFFTLRESIAMPPHIADVFRTMDAWLIKGVFSDPHRPSHRHRRLPPQQRAGARDDPRRTAAGFKRGAGLGAAMRVSRRCHPRRPVSA